jgi:hypothetical protein
MAPEFSNDGPHSPELTRAAADQAADRIRYLNYATRADQGGLVNVEDAYELVASLHIAMQRMPQLLDQIRSFLQSQEDAGRLASDDGEPRRRAAVSRGALLTALEHAESVTRNLRAAQNAMAGLSVKENPGA